MDYQEIMEQRNNYVAFAQNMGLRFVEMSEGYAKTELQLDERHRNENGDVHGGVLFALADTTGSGAVNVPGEKSTTLNGTINYMRPAKPGQKITGEAHTIKRGRTISVIEVNIFNEEKKIVNCTFNYYHITEE